ncbi:MAG TPA: type II secretion system F family protein, partial [Phycisphaerae bacterium]|nr:type II secretion system F family protein [Phycisphaerae bacterium]
MPTFAYQVREDSGKMNSGVLAAPDITEASRSLRREGGVIVDLREEFSSAAGGVDPAAALGAPTQKVRRNDVIFFATQLAIMVDTGVPLDEALDAIAEQSEHAGLKALLRDLSDQVKAGTDFSSALESHPKIF